MNRESELTTLLTEWLGTLEAKNPSKVYTITVREQHVLDSRESTIELSVKSGGY